ncbi:DUF362 domain-containing protein [Streptomyces cyaneofuscatus]|uniref:DUF362 domain-containing protein n=1 Tax=Streptomyces cyaneofuscatus TaxID=66883 RepID=UPI0036B2C407
MAYAIGERCVDVADGSCVQVCPVDATYEGRRKPCINSANCIDCGARAEACPNGAPLVVRAGAVADPVAAQDAVYGPIGVDTEAVAAHRP